VSIKIRRYLSSHGAVADVLYSACFFFSFSSIHIAANVPDCTSYSIPFVYTFFYGYRIFKSELLIPLANGRDWLAPEKKKNIRNGFIN
jgi:hypothetical protein